jgi:hypothetical protein
MAKKASTQPQDADGDASASTQSNDNDNNSLSTVAELRAQVASLSIERNRALKAHRQTQNELAILSANSVVPLTFWRPYLRLTVLLVFLALILFVSAEHQLSKGRPSVFGSLATLGVICFVLSIPSAHLAGRYIYETYRMWQPFKGGIRFVVLQGLSWSLYAFTTAMIFFGLYFAESSSVTGVLAMGGVVGVIAQCFMVSSLFAFNEQHQQQKQTQQRPGSVSNIQFIRLLLYLALHVCVCV